MQIYKSCDILSLLRGDSQMLKSELIDNVSKKLNHLTVSDVSCCVGIIIDTMATHLTKPENPTENRIEIRGFGSFSLRYRAPRQAHNPKTGEKLVTDEKFAFHYKPGKEIRERINNSRHLPIQKSSVTE